MTDFEKNLQDAKTELIAAVIIYIAKMDRIIAEAKK